MFSSLTQPNYPSVALGISADRLTAVELQGEGRGVYGIKQAATFDLPAGICVPSFAESNIETLLNSRAMSEKLQRVPVC